MSNDILVFETREDFRKWLKKNAETHNGVWLMFGKKKEIKTLSANDALEEALCFGWIDGLMNSIDETRYKKYFSIRRKGSHWSEKNKSIAQDLISKGKMTDAGLAAIEAARKNGQWEKAKDRSISAEYPGGSKAQKDEFESKINTKKAAWENYLKMAKSTQKQFIGFYFEAKKEETREKRLEKIIDRLTQNKKLM